jgi:hypothetical protein
MNNNTILLILAGSELPIRFYWNWKFQWKELELLEYVNLPMFYVHWKLPIKFFWRLDIIIGSFHWKLPILLMPKLENLSIVIA